MTISPANLALITVTAAAHGIDWRIVRAMVVIESGGNPYAWNPEPHYGWLWNVREGRPFRPLSIAERTSERPPHDFPMLAGDRDQEFWGQQASWGLMQVMGAVARERGFTGPYLPEICEPQLNLELGCRHLNALLKWANDNEDKAIAAYNGGPGNWHSLAADRYRLKVRAEMKREPIE